MRQYLKIAANTGSNLLLFARALLIGGRRSQLGYERVVFLDLSDPRLERYLYWLVKMFDIAGWGVVFRIRPWLLLNLRNRSEYIYDTRNLRFALAAPTDVDLIVTDRVWVSNAIYVDTDYFGAKEGESVLRLPFFMHPDVYHTGLIEKLPDIRAHAFRRIKVFLGGNLGDVYDTDSMRERFGLMNRSEVTKTVLDSFEGKPTYFEITTGADAEAVLSGGTAADVVVMKRPLVPLPKWMELLAASEFFLAPPGLLMPFSHNIIEAMALGTIPITEYGHMFDPPLVHGETCLAFSNEVELRDRITQALNMETEDVERMRRNVIQYYDAHLEPGAVVSKIYERREKLKRIYLIAGHLSVSAMER
jgi:hypothetical protein